jgi:hypothetical protein
MMGGHRISCSACGRYHTVQQMLRDPDRPQGLLCPLRFSGVMRLSYKDKLTSDRLLRLAFGGPR